MTERAMNNFEAMQRASKLQFESDRFAPTLETTPNALNAQIASFCGTLSSETPQFISVTEDVHGLYGWCSIGVQRKVQADGGAAVFGWTIWQWAGLFLNAEFHSVWRSPAGKLEDITPKPQGELQILFVPDLNHPADFDFTQRPRNRRIRLYRADDDPVVLAEIEGKVANLRGAQRAYEERRAAKAGKTLREWVSASRRADQLSTLIDRLIECCEKEARYKDQLVAAKRQGDRALYLMTQQTEAALKALTAASASLTGE